MDTLYLETSSLVQDIYPYLSRLEKAASAATAADLERDIEQRLGMITSNCERLDVLVNKEPPSRRRNAKYRVDQLKYDCKHLQAAVTGMIQKRTVRERYEYDRQELLSTKFQPNDASTDSTSIFIGDAELEHRQRLQNTDRQLDDLISSGSMALESLRSQGMSLKDVKRKILDVANTLGLSNTVMRLIERRTAQDRIVLFGGMLLTLFIMYVLFRWIKG